LQNLEKGNVMQDAFKSVYRLSKRSEAGLTCDEKGVALGPIALVERAHGKNQAFQVRPTEEIARTLALAYGPLTVADYIRRVTGLNIAARALNDGDLALAGIATAFLKLPKQSPDAFAKLSADSTLRKYDENEPRDEDGRWV
jgi:hypothetical protein